MDTCQLAEPAPPRATVRRIADSLLVVSCLTAVLYFYVGPRSLPSSAMAMAPAIEESEDGVKKVGWDILAQLDVATGKTGPELTEVVDETVKIPGYVVPLDEDGMEFLLAPWLGACIHEPTPPPNQMVHVRLKKGAKPIDPWGWDPLWVTGKLSVGVTESPYGAVGFELAGDSAEIYRW